MMAVFGVYPQGRWGARLLRQEKSARDLRIDGRLLLKQRGMILSETALDCRGGVALAWEDKPTLRKSALSP